MNGAWMERVATAWRSLQEHRLRSSLTVVGIVIGITTVIALQALIDGLNRSVEQQFRAIGADMISVNLYPWGIRVGGGGSRREPARKPLTMADVDAVRSCPSVLVAVPAIYEYQQVRYRQRVIGPLAIVGTGEDFTRVENYPLASGRFLTQGDERRATHVAVLGHDVQRGLFGEENPLGKEVLVAGKPYVVVGVLAKTGSIFGSSRDNLVVIPASSFQRQFGTLRSVNISVLPVSRHLVEAAKEEIRIALRRQRRVRPQDPDDFALNTADQLIAQYRSLTGAMFAAMVALGGLSLVVGGIGIMNIMLVSVTERTREIGVRRALGATRNEIRLQFLTEAVMLCLAGGLAGTGAGMGLAWFIGAVSPLSCAVKPGTVALGVAFASAVGVVFGFAPATRAAGLNPVEALRHE